MRFVQVGDTIINLAQMTDCSFQKGEGEARLTVYFAEAKPREGCRTYSGIKAERVWEALLCQCEDIVNLEPKNDRQGRNPAMAQTMAELVTPRQLVAIRGIANSNKLDAQVECQELHNCKPEELSRQAASLLIDHLKGKGCERGGMQELPLGTVEDLKELIAEPANVAG